MCACVLLCVYCSCDGVGVPRNAEPSHLSLTLCPLSIASDSLFSRVSLFQDVVSGRHRAGKLGLGGAVGRHDPNSPHEVGGCRRVSTCWLIRTVPVSSDCCCCSYCCDMSGYV